MNKKIEEEKIISVLLASSTRKEASKKLGIGLNALYARMNSPDFKDKYQKARDALIKEVIDRLQTSMLEAVEVIKEILNDRTLSPQIRLNASDALLRHGTRMIEQREILERIERLEALTARE